MKNRKEINESEPGWKKRRREEQIQARKTKLWIAIGVAAGILALGFLIFTTVRAGIDSTPKKQVKKNIVHGIARVKDKKIEKVDNKTKRIIIFSVGSFTAKKEVSEATYNKMKKGDEVMLAYEANRYTGMPDYVQGWKPFKLEGEEKK